MLKRRNKLKHDAKINQLANLKAMEILPDSDLIISYFKRLEKIKDTGKVLPGHGGIFDRIDGLMFVVIIASIYYYFI